MTAKTAAGTIRHKCNGFASPEPYSLSHRVLRELGKIRYRKSRATSILFHPRCQIRTPRCQIRTPRVPNRHLLFFTLKSLAGLITELPRLEQAACVESVPDLRQHQSNGSKRA